MRTRQIRFFSTERVDSALLGHAEKLGLVVASGSMTTRGAGKAIALGFVDTDRTSAWFDDEYIEYSTDPLQFEARLWFDPMHRNGAPKSGRICRAYDQLVRFVKNGSRFDREHRFWVASSDQEEFLAASEQRRRELDELVARNEEYAIRVLGARIKPVG